MLKAKKAILNSESETTDTGAGTGSGSGTTPTNMTTDPALKKTLIERRYSFSDLNAEIVRDDDLREKKSPPQPQQTLSPNKLKKYSSQAQINPNNPTSPQPLRPEFKRRRPKKHIAQTGIEFFGAVLAIAYGALCGMGINAKVAAAFANSAINAQAAGFAIGSVTFFVNTVLFWTVVPAMFVKLFLKWDLYDESFAAKTKIGDKERYVKLKHKGKIARLQWFSSTRPWVITAFVMYFGLATGLAYTGLLMSTLPTTLAEIGILASGLGLMLTCGFFFGVSAICNWAFNSYDAAEQFSKNDFYEKLKDGLLELLLIKHNPALLEKNEKYTPEWFGSNDNEVGFIGMRVRQLIRLAIFTGICFLGYYAIYSVAHMGTLGLLTYLMPSTISGVELGQTVFSIAKYGSSAIQFLKWSVIVGSIVGASFLYGVQLTRFSTMATKVLTQLGKHYASYGESFSNPVTKALFLTVFSPVIVAAILCEGIWNGLIAEKTYALKAYQNESPKTVYKEACEDYNDDWREEAYNEDPNITNLKSLETRHPETSFETWWSKQSFFRRATHDVSSCFKEVAGSENSPFYGLRLIPAVIACIPVFLFHFMRNNIHALAAINATAQGLLAVKDGKLAESLEAASGNTAASAMCYANKISHDMDKEAGVSTDKQDFYSPSTLLYRHARAHYPNEYQYVELDETEVKEIHKHDAHVDFYIDDPNCEIARRFAPSKQH